VFDLVSYFHKNKDRLLTVEEFYTEVGESLASDSITSDAKFDHMQNVWETARNYNHSKEDKKIAELQKRNFEKFETLKSIL
jgi:hypothetical protein